MIQNLQNPHDKSEYLLNGFYNIDLATILRLHFREFADKKPNTVEKNAKASIDKLRPNDPKVQKLTQAMEEFFYA